MAVTGEFINSFKIGETRPISLLKQGFTSHHQLLSNWARAHYHWMGALWLKVMLSDESKLRHDGNDGQVKVGEGVSTMQHVAQFNMNII